MERYATIVRSLLVLGILLAHGPVVAKESRLALIIGNGDYKESPLRNPINDAEDMATTLESLGFEVILTTNANRRQMARSIRDFGRQLKQKRGVGLFYYAGHGLQIDSSNYLIPIDAPLEEEDEVPYESIDVGSVLAKMESAGNALNLMILDACRNNPFPSQFRSSSRGLARVEAPVGSLVVYSTAPGKIAADGDGRNGVFTGHLLTQLKTSGLSLTETIRRTRAAVVAETNGRQVPWESSSLLKDYYLSPIKKPAPKPTTAIPANSGNDANTLAKLEQQSSGQTGTDTGANALSSASKELQSFAPEVIFWNSVEQGKSKAEYQAYLSRYPNGLFAELASFRLDALNKQNELVVDNSASTTTASNTPSASATSSASLSASSKSSDDAASPAPSAIASNATPATAPTTPVPVDAVADIPLTIGFKDTGNKPTPTPVDQANSQDTATASLEAPIVLARKSIETVPDKPKLIDKFKKPAGGSRSKLTVSVVPDDARIRIMNIVEKYKPGISLDRSKSYDVYVTRPGYESFRDKIKLTDDEQELAIVLPQRELSMPLTVPLSGGTFTMGCSKSDSQCQSYEKPAHSVSVDSFAMTKTEITVSQFSDFVNATGYVTDAEKNAGGNKGCFVWSDGGGISRSSSRWGWKAGTNWRKPGYAQKGNFPVTCVSWNDSVAYAKWLSNKSGRHFTLPTEAQWEYAARAGSDARYVASNNANSLCAHANVADRSLSPTGSKWSDRVACNDNYWFSAPVSSFKPNKLGLHDMQGNVWEWVDDVWASSFKNTPRNGMANTQGKSSDRVLRGGAWDGDEKRLRISNRSKASTSNRAAMTGFRLVAR